MSGAWVHRRGAAYPAHGAFFSADGIFLCQLLPEAPRLVCEHNVKKKGMTVQTKLGIIIPVTLVMGIGFFMMMRANVLVPSIILAIVWVCHIIYFVFGVKTIRKKV